MVSDNMISANELDSGMTASFKASHKDFNTGRVFPLRARGIGAVTTPSDSCTPAAAEPGVTVLSVILVTRKATRCD